MAKRNDLTKDQGKELLAIFKNVLKNELKRNISSVRLLETIVFNEDNKQAIQVKAYFFSVGADIDRSSVACIRWNMNFTTKFYDTFDLAFDAMKTIISNKNNYNFIKDTTLDNTALYPNTYNLVFEE